MTSWTVAICGILYLATGVKFLLDKQFSWSLVYFSYAMANVGLILAALNSPAKA